MKLLLLVLLFVTGAVVAQNDDVQLLQVIGWRDYLSSLVSPAISRALSVTRQATGFFPPNLVVYLSSLFAILAPGLYALYTARLFMFPSVAAFGKKRSSRDLFGVNHEDPIHEWLDWLVEQTKMLNDLSTRVERSLKNFRRAMDAPEYHGENQKTPGKSNTYK